MRRAKVHVLAMVCSALFACGDCGGQGGGDGGADAGPRYTAENLCLVAAGRQCDFYVRCHVDPGALLGLSGFEIADGGLGNQVPESERSRCEAALSSDRTCRALASGVALGRSAVDGARFDACLDSAWPRDVCVRDVMSALQACAGYPYLAPKVAPPGACSFEQECDGGYCDAPSPDACGRCQAPSAVTGTPCDRDRMCDPATHYCRDADHTCQPYTAIGASCDIQHPLQPQCGPGNVCARVVGGLFPTYRCAAARLLGEPCDMPTGGIPYLECLRSGRELIELACAPLGPPDGGAAVPRCAPVQAPLNGSCGNGEGAALGYANPICPETQFCQANVCVNRLGASLACGADEMCAFGLRCLPPPGGGQATCQPYLDVGSACAAGSDCRALLGCAGTCQPRLSLASEPCGAERACAGGYCPQDAGTPLCLPLLDAGSPCASGAECGSNSCSGSCQLACWE